jgi:mRNA interferase MazF
MRRGEVWHVRLPPASGPAQSGDRPALVVQHDAFTAALPTALVVPFTGNLAAARFAGTLRVDPDGANGLTVPSIAMVFQLRAVDQRDCVQRLGEVDAATLAAVTEEKAVSALFFLCPKGDRTPVSCTAFCGLVGCPRARPSGPSLLRTRGPPSTGAPPVNKGGDIVVLC